MEFNIQLKILIAEDDPVFRDLVSDIIKNEGYIPIEASNGREALDIFYSTNDIDLVILDVMMPHIDGWEVLKDIRTVSEIPIIMLTALSDEKHEVIGLKKGADDYISKPFSYEIFVARLNALLRKVKASKPIFIEIGGLKIDRSRQKFWIKEEEIPLNRKEYKLLLYFIEKQNRVLTRDKILDDVWGFDFYGDNRTIDTHVKTLRAKLKEYGRYIKTVRGTGYMFEVD